MEDGVLQEGAFWVKLTHVIEGLNIWLEGKEQALGSIQRLRNGSLNERVIEEMAQIIVSLEQGNVSTYIRERQVQLDEHLICQSLLLLRRHMGMRGNS